MVISKTGVQVKPYFVMVTILISPASYRPKWPIRCHQECRWSIQNRMLYFKTRYLYYYYVSGWMRDYDYGQSLLDKRPYLVTGLASREVRTDAIRMCS